MLEFARPGLLLAGLLASLVPLALHLIARRPPERAALPTARFLAPDPRTSVRVRRRPTDPLLLALRMLLLALLGAAAAGPAWIPRREGTAELVLLDRGAGMRGEPWRAAVDAARRALLDPEGGARGDLVLFDTAAVRVARGRLAPALFDSLAGAGPGSAPSRYAAALRAVPSAARGLRGADSVRVTLLSAPREEGWSPGLARLRRAAWPGAVRTPPLPPPAEGSQPRAEPPRGTAVVLAPPGAGRYAAAALGAAGWRVGAGADSAAAYVVLGGAPGGDRLLAAVRRGATLVVSGDAPAALRGVSPWDAAAGTGGAGGTMVFADGLELAGAARRGGGSPRAGAAVLAAWEDGRPAAAAARVGRGCVVAVAAALEGGSLPLSAAYPRAVDRLLRGCEPDTSEDGAVPLDAGALSVLRGDGPSAVPVASLGAAGGGIPLGRWVLAAALLAALVETVLAYGRRRAP